MAWTARKDNPKSTFSVQCFSFLLLVPFQPPCLQSLHQEVPEEAFDRVSSRIKESQQVKVPLALQPHKTGSLPLGLRRALHPTPGSPRSPQGQLWARREETRAVAASSPHHHSLNRPFSTCEKRITESVLCTLSGCYEARKR